MTYVLKINSASIRKRIEAAGLRICPCCTFDGAVWLIGHDNIEGIHGEGYEIEELDLLNVEDVLANFEKENKYIDCNYNVEKFIKLCKNKD